MLENLFEADILRGNRRDAFDEGLKTEIIGMRTGSRVENGAQSLRIIFETCKSLFHKLFK